MDIYKEIGRDSGVSPPGSGATAGDPVPPGWEAHPVGLEELALAYPREPGAAALPGPACSRQAEPSKVIR
jgi:hypothetical protein